MSAPLHAKSLPHFAEIRNQGATPEEIGEIEDRFAVMVNEQARAQQGDFSTIRRTGKNTSDFRQLIDIALSGDSLERDGDGNAIGDDLRLKDMREFEGINGAAPVSIVVLESRAKNSTRHSAAVENVIESQLQEAGQGYKMTNLEYFDRLDVALAEIAQIAPDYANFSLDNRISPEFLGGVAKVVEN